MSMAAQWLLGILWVLQVSKRACRNLYELLRTYYTRYLSILARYSLQVNLPAYLPYVSGARCVATILHEMTRRGKDCRFGVISMCIGLSTCLLLCHGSSSLTPQ
ncbi:hypothetical protein CsSME_00041576 [Camellia sinensis var. sinensis]